MKAIDPLLKVVEDHSHLPDQHTISDKRAQGSRASNSTSNSTSGEEGYDSINSDEEVPVEVCLSGLSVISSGRLFVPDRVLDHGSEDDGFPTLGRGLCRTLSLNDGEDSGVSASSTASSAASSLSRGSPCSTPKGPPAFQELKVTSDLSSTASPKRVAFTVGTPPLSIDSQDGDVACRRVASFTLGTPRSTPHGSPCDSPRKELQVQDAAPKAAARADVPVSGDLGGELSAEWNRTVTEAKEQAFSRLQEELRSAHQELRLRDEEVTRLSRIREQVEAELEELTASLFQEAHNMVRDANTRQAAAERSLAEARMQVEVLTAEVAALKTLVLTSTPAKPNPHLHPQIDKTKSCDDSTGSGLFRKHRRSPSHYNLKYGRENSPPDSPVKENHSQSVPTGSCIPQSTQDQVEPKDGIEVDPNVHRDFLAWRQNPSIEKSSAFIARVYREDIDLCLDFNNRELAERVGHAIETGNIYIEAVGDRSKTVFPKKCALLEVPRQCNYRMKLGDQDTWHSISQICRNRITAVIDFLNYLRYIERGLVKSSVHDTYWEVVRLRKEMCLARLGLSLSSYNQ